MKSKKIRRNLHHTKKYRKKNSIKKKAKFYRRKTRKQGGNNEIKDQITSVVSNNVERQECGKIGESEQLCRRHTDSKSGQIIKICDRSGSVFKGPPKGFEPKVYVNSRNNVIGVDPHTMNLLVQGCINQLKIKRTQREVVDVTNIEKYDEICKLDEKSYMLKGPKYSYNLNDFDNKLEGGVFSIEDFIKKTAEYIDNNKGVEPRFKTNIAIKIIKWSLSLTKNLDTLFYHMQFHHCDPKAAQLFLNEKGEVILGDLDKVTFTMNVGSVPYRIRLFGSKTAQQTLDVMDKIGSVFFKQKSSIPTIMRYEDKPYQDNKYEKAVFIASILLLLHEDIANEVVNFINNYNTLREKLEINIKPEINIYMLNLQILLKTILIEKINTLRKQLDFKSRTSHVIASKCVKFISNTNKNSKNVLKSIVTLDDISHKKPTVHENPIFDPPSKI
tara:strand:- start:22751 stop:24079 length:1329 start_codon:yes stop_codon:yes gene_type:complete